MPLLHARHVPGRRHLHLRRVSPLLLAQELRGAPDRCRSSTHSSAPWPRRTRSSGGRRSHRVHHKYVDKDWDPYNIQRGFWWAHILWIFYRNEQRDDTFANAPDLLANPIVMWQHRWHKVDPDRRRLRPADADRRGVRRSAGRPAVGRLPAHRRHPSHDVLRELAGALPRQAGLQRRGLGARQLARGAAHARRGLPLLPSPLPRRLPQRHPLVSVGSGEVVHRRAALAGTGQRTSSPRRCRRSNRPACAPRCAWSSRRWPRSTADRRRSAPPARRRRRASRESIRPLAPRHRRARAGNAVAPHAQNVARATSAARAASGSWP